MEQERLTQSQLDDLASFLVQAWHGNQASFARSISPDVILSAEHTEDDTIVLGFELGRSRIAEQTERMGDAADDLTTLLTQVRGVVWFSAQTPVPLEFTLADTGRRIVRYDTEFDMRNANLNAPSHR